MLTITRTWNAIGAVGGMRGGLALARDYAKRRIAFGGPLAEKPLHVDTLASSQAEFHGAFLITFRAIELLGKDENAEIDESEATLDAASRPDSSATVVGGSPDPPGAAVDAGPGTASASPAASATTAKGPTVVGRT